MVLIVAPNSALGSWGLDLEKEGEKSVQYLHGTRTERLTLLSKPKRWNLVNKEAHLAIPELNKFKWDAVILDESHCIKDPRSKITKYFLKSFKNADHRWLLTGTPNPKSDLEFWPQFAFLDGKAFGCSTYWKFRSTYFKQPMFGNPGEWIPKVGSISNIKREVAERAFVLRRKDVDMDVPKVYEERLLTLPPALLKAYTGLARDFILDFRGKEVSRTIYAPVTTTWLRQLCGGFLNKKLAWRGKLWELIELLNGELANEQVVIWFNYNHELYAACDFLNEKGITTDWITGAKKPKDRRKTERAFNTGKVQALLMQVKVAEEGMNLSAADTAIYYSPPYGTKARAQTEDRILDVVKDGPLLIIDLLVRDSVDTAYLEVLQSDIYRQGNFMDRVRKLIEKQEEAR